MPKNATTHSHSRPIAPTKSVRKQQIVKLCINSPPRQINSAIIKHSSPTPLVPLHHRQWLFQCSMQHSTNPRAKPPSSSTSKTMISYPPSQHLRHNTRSFNSVQTSLDHQFHGIPSLPPVQFCILPATGFVLSPAMRVCYPRSSHL